MKESGAVAAVEEFEEFEEILVEFFRVPGEIEEQLEFEPVPGPLQPEVWELQKKIEATKCHFLLWKKPGNREL